MRLTKRQRFLLELLTQDEVDVAASGTAVYVGEESTSYGMLKFLLRNMLVKDVTWDDKPTCRYYEISSWGRRVLTDPNFEPAQELLRLMAEAKSR